MIRAASSRTGQLLWEFDSAREFTTANGVAAKGGSAASGGPTVANGMVFVGSGYPGFQMASRETRCWHSRPPCTSINTPTKC